MDLLAEYAIVAARRRVKIKNVARAARPRNWQQWENLNGKLLTQASRGVERQQLIREVWYRLLIDTRLFLNNNGGCGVGRGTGRGGGEMGLWLYDFMTRRQAGK